MRNEQRGFQHRVGAKADRVHSCSWLMSLRVRNGQHHHPLGSSWSLTLKQNWGSLKTLINIAKIFAIVNSLAWKQWFVLAFFHSIRMVNYSDLLKDKCYVRLTSPRGLHQKMASLKPRKPCLILFLGPPTPSAYSTSFYPVVASSLYSWSKPGISRSLLISLLPSSSFFFKIVQFGNAFDVFWDFPGDSQ